MTEEKPKSIAEKSQEDLVVDLKFAKLIRIKEKLDRIYNVGEEQWLKETRQKYRYMKYNGNPPPIGEE